MSNLFGTLDLARRSLQAHRLATEVAGHNLANVNNPAYARQRLSLQTVSHSPGDPHSAGDGVQSAGIFQLRNSWIDSQINVESSVRGALESRLGSLEFMQSSLGRVIDPTSADGIADQGLGSSLTSFFNAFQSASTQPTSLPERQILLAKAENLASQFRQIDGRLDNLRLSIDDSLRTDVASANGALDAIARLNLQISRAEASAPGAAVDLRDLRQQQVETLAQFLKVDAAELDGSLQISAGGVLLVDGTQRGSVLELFDSNGSLLVRAGSVEPLTLSGGSIQGWIDARDGALDSLKSSINALASTLIDTVNSVHEGGFSLGGDTGALFFSGSTAASIRVNSDLAADPARLQLSRAPDEPSDNSIALALAELASAPQPALGGQSFLQKFAHAVTGLGEDIASTRRQLENQQLVEGMLKRQRDSVSGVSLDEEMTDLIKFQKAFEASARLITVLDDMLGTILNLKR